MAKITEYLEILLAGSDLTFDQAKGLLDIIFEGDVADAQIAAFLAAMRAKGSQDLHSVENKTIDSNGHQLPVRVLGPGLLRERFL